MAKKKHVPATVEELKPCPWNPRAIDGEAMQGLQASVKAFGDISGIVFNSRTGHLVAGHQRLTILKQTHKLTLEGDNGTLAVVTDAGTRFPVRLVDWDDATEKAANVAANSPHIAGRFTEGLAPILVELETDLPELSATLRLPALHADIAPIIAVPAGEGAPDEIWAGMPECEHENLQPWKSLTINFASSDDLESFASLIGQTLTPKTRSIWHPPAEIGHYADKRYVNES